MIAWFRSSPVLNTVVLATVLTAALLGLVFAFDLDAQVRDLLEWLAATEEAAAAFVAIMVLVVVLLLPGVLFTTGAGFLFGTLAGTTYVVIGTTVGATIAFLLARYTLGERAQQWIVAHAAMRTLNDVASSEGWRIVLLTRLIPFFPGKASNYAFGLTRVPLRDFVIGTFFGVIPFTLHNAYLGSLAADVVMVGEMPRGRTPMEWAVLGLGLVVLTTAVVALGRVARRALREAQRRQGRAVSEGGEDE